MGNFTISPQGGKRQEKDVRSEQRQNQGRVKKDYDR